MKTLHLFPFATSILLLFAVSFIGCGDSEIEGCTNAFATNFDSSATKDCCCEFDVEALIDDLVGSYDFKVDRSDIQVNYNYIPISIERDPENNQRFLIKDFWIHDIQGTFESGEFKLESEIEDFLDCRSQTSGFLRNDQGTLYTEMEFRTWQTTTIPENNSCDTHDFTSVGELLRR